MATNKTIEFENFLIETKNESSLILASNQKIIINFFYDFYKEENYELCQKAVELIRNKNYKLYSSWFLSSIKLGKLFLVEKIIKEASEYFLNRNLLNRALDFSSLIKDHYKNKNLLDFIILELAFRKNDQDNIKRYFRGILNRAQQKGYSLESSPLQGMNLTFEPNSVSSKIISNKIRMLNQNLKLEARIKLIFEVLLLSSNLMEDCVDLLFLNKNNSSIQLPIFNFLFHQLGADYNEMAKKYHFISQVRKHKKIKYRQPVDPDKVLIKEILKRKFINWKRSNGNAELEEEYDNEPNILSDLSKSVLSPSDKLNYLILNNLKLNFEAFVSMILSANNKLDIETYESAVIIEGFLYFKLYNLGIDFFSKVEMNKATPEQIYVYAECLYQKKHKSEARLIFKKIASQLGTSHRLISERVKEK